MPGKSPRGWRFRALDILEAIEKCETFSKGRERDDFLSDELAFSAALHQLQIIGEATSHLPATLKDRYPHDWTEIVAMRHRIVHGYFGVDADIIWSTLMNDLKPLRRILEEILAREPPD
jgi:uncharacterized protein with HEPN domain